MRTLIHGGTVVTGDGTTVLERATVSVVDGRIASIGRAATDPVAGDAHLIDASGHIVMPGLVNMHAHGVSGAPLFPAAETPLPEERWLANLDRHLLAGTTTVLSVCGFGTMEAVRDADARHAVNVRGATTHTPAALRAAESADGAGLTDRERGMSVERMLEDGAVAIGELAGGQTLGGGGQDLVYIPNALLRATGVRVSQEQAREMKEAVLGRFLDAGACDGDRLARAAADAGVSGRITLDELASLIAGTVMSSVAPAIDGIREGVRLARELRVPAIVHSAAASAAVIRDLLPEGTTAPVIAAHVNHTSHTPEEAVALAREGRDHGWFGEACVFDLLRTRHTVRTTEHWEAVLGEPELVSVLATDYGHNGAHDPLLAGVADVWLRGYRSLPAAVAMASSAVADLVPGLVDGGAVLRAGAPADLVIARANAPDEVRDVFVRGVQVVREGTLTARARR